MSKIDYRRLKIMPKTGYLQDVLTQILEEFSDALQERELTIDLTESIETLSPIDFDQEAMVKVIRHLVVNAIKFTPDGGIIHINANEWDDVDRKDDWPSTGVHLSLSDSGIGIDKEELDAIFNKFYQMADLSTHSSGSTKFMAGGTGLGLAIVRGIVNAHRGMVWAESSGLGTGSTFHIVLPKRFEKIRGIDQLEEEPPPQTIGYYLEDIV